MPSLIVKMSFGDFVCGADEPTFPGEARLEGGFLRGSATDAEQPGQDDKHEQHGGEGQGHLLRRGQNHPPPGTTAPRTDDGINATGRTVSSPNRCLLSTLEREGEPDIRGGDFKIKVLSVFDCQQCRVKQVKTNFLKTKSQKKLSTVYTLSC